MSILREIAITTEHDIVLCRRACREVAKDYHFNLVDQTRITTAASELARNIFEYAGTGKVTIEIMDNATGDIGLKAVFQDSGPGIEDLDSAMREGWTSHKGMGLGLPGSRKLVDEFDIQSTLGEGTTVTIIKWRKQG